MSDNREQEDLWREIDEILEIACAKLSPKQADLLRWAVHGDSPSRWGAVEDDLNGQLFV